MHIAKTTITALLCTFVLVMAADHAALAATGQSLLLGRSNTADRMTVLSRTTSGPPLHLQAAAGASAPFSTNARGKVANLDADRLDGLEAAALRTHGRVFTGSVPQPRTAMSMLLPLPAGNYLVTYHARLTTTSDSAGCQLLRLAPDGSGRYFGGTSQHDPDSVSHGVTGSSFVSIGTGVKLRWECGVDTGQTFTTPGHSPLQVVATRLDSVTTAVVTPSTARRR